jgi:Icc-related predicted phosphoesterase
MLAGLIHRVVILVIADDESLLGKLPEAPADVLISCGDLPDELILQAAKRAGCKEILAVKGNHDSSFAFPKPILDLHLQTRQVGDLIFGGFAGAWKYKPKGNYLFEQSEVDASLAKFPRVDVFVTHNSPRSIHDREDEIHTGFTAFISYIARAQPRILLHGHQHKNVESKVVGSRIIGTYGHRFLVL